MREWASVAMAQKLGQIKGERRMVKYIWSGGVGVMSSQTEATPAKNRNPPPRTPLVVRRGLDRQEYERQKIEVKLC